MKTIEIEGIRLTEAMINRIRSMQEDEGEGIEGYLIEVDRAIRFIALLSNEYIDDDNKGNALRVIGELSAIREMFTCFSGKEIRN